MSNCERLLKIDIDVKVPSEWLSKWLDTRAVLLKHLGYHPLTMRVYSTKRGYHVFIRLKECVDYDELIRLQFLLGDDHKRVYFSLQRSGFVKYRLLFNVLFAEKYRIKFEEGKGITEVREYYAP